MASCKDCVHVEVCRFKDLSAPLSDSHIRESECIEKRCGDFQDRTRFVELPCKVGDTVYFILRSFDGKVRIKPEKVCYFTIDANELRIHTTAGYFTERDMNDGVFFTRERAEQALKERKENDKQKRPDR